MVHAGDPAGQAESDDLAGDELGAQLGTVGAEVGDDRRENPGGDEVAEGLDVTALAERGMDDCGEAVRARVIPQADEGAHNPLPQLFGLELGDGGRPVHEVGIDPGGRLDNGLGEERGPVREVVVDQGRVDASVARDATQGGLVAVAGEGGAGRRQDGLTRIRAPRGPPPPRAHRSLVSLIVRACPHAAPLGSSRATAPNRRATLRTQAGAARIIVSATSQRVLSDVVEQPFAHAPKDGLLHDSDLLGETLT